ncbi:MAG: PHP domain-containing protein [Treponema sp.]|nr:PHP domain-containing protein [Treponema sp.]
MIDLHSHSNASDGRKSPADSARYAAEKKLSVWALTDHDTVAGLHEAAVACKEADVIFVPGIEITVNWQPGDFHLLGHGLTHCSSELTHLIEKLKESRDERNDHILEKMAEDGIHATTEEIKAFCGVEQLGRPHFADYLVYRGVVKNRQAAFDSYLAQGRPWFIHHNGADLDEAISAIKSSGGLPVLAHPLSLYVSWGKMEGVLTDIVAHGIQGIEAWHPGARVGEAIRLEELARKLGCFVTAGSDFHGEGVRADRHLGKTSGGKKIADRFWTEELLPHLPEYNVEWWLS